MGDKGTYSFQQFASRLYQPQAIQSVLKEQEAALPPPSQLTPPPTLGLTVDINAGKLTAKVSVHSADGLKALRFYADGIEVHEEALSGREAFRTIELPRLKNARWITAIAEDINGFLSHPAARQLGQQGPPNSRLLVLAIGIDHYSDPRLGRLSFANSDAAAIAETLKRGHGAYYGAAEITVWRDEQAKPAAVRAKLRELVERAEPGDTIIFSYASHGLRGSDGRYYLATSATEINRLEETALPWTDIVQVLNRAKTRVLVFIDACHAGTVNAGMGATNDGAVDQLMKNTKAPVLARTSFPRGRYLH